MSDARGTEGTRSRSRRRRLALAYGAPLLLAAIALLQLHLAHAHRLSPWKGGGFGMFATVDLSAHRFLRAYLVTDTGDVPIRVRRGTGRLRGPARLAAVTATMPTDRRLDALATVLAAQRWTSDSLPTLPPRSEPGATGPAGEFSAVRLEAWRIEYDRGTGTVRGRMLAQTTRSRP